MIVYRWHNWVAQPKMNKAWHESDVADELKELVEARRLIDRWSEMSDVVYTVTRARWSGHDVEYPISRTQRIAGHLYMYPKYSSRAIFFRRAGKKAGAQNTLQCVRNPKKAHKLKTIAQQNNLDTDTFTEICNNQRRYWPLLP